MRSTLPRFLRSAAVAAALVLPLATVAPLAPTAALAQSGLPAPYLSYALDAILLPVDDAVRATFGLAPENSGVFVLATAPGGLAEGAGLVPGDVLDYVQGEAILSPEDLDAIIWNWLQQGITDYTFDGLRAGAPLATDILIKVEYWEETVEITEISSWSSYSSESFSYEEYSAEYSEEISASYEEEVFESEDSAMEETVEDEEMIDDGAAEEEVIDEGGGDEGGGDEGGEEIIEE